MVRERKAETVNKDDLPHDAGETTPIVPRSIHEEDTLYAGLFSSPQQPPPGGGYGQQPPPGSAGSLAARRRWWVIGGAVAVVAAVIVALVVFTGGEDSSSTDATATTPAKVPAGPSTTAAATPRSTPAPAPPPPPPVVDAAALPGLLLPADLINQRMNTTGMTADPPLTELLSGSVTPPHCTGAWGPAYGATYKGSGYTGLAIQGFFQPPIQMVQAVVSFPDAGAAKAFYDRQVADWNACKSTHIRYEGGGVTEADLGVPSVAAGIMTLLLVPTTARTAGQQCERDMALRSNVIVDVRACSPTVGSAGFSIANEIAERIAPTA
ncbi:MAG: sensor domain-containing protein [Mycobacteriaceae bacterium]|nr:sensor domain-containing protein [Mycobacteriaceae bacterium]